MPERYSKIVHQFGWPRWVFELLIVAGIVIFTDAALLAFQFQTTLMNVLGALCLLASLTIIYGSVIEPWFLTVKRFDVPPMPRLRGAGVERVVTIAFLSDIHVGPYKKERWLERVVRKVNGLNPDIVLLGGDLVFDEPDQAPMLAPLAGLKPKLGTFAILGNHEWYYEAVDAVEKVLTQAGIPVLRNRSMRVAEHLLVAGTDDDWYAETDFDAAMKDRKPDDAVILMVHNPEVASHAASYKPALMLSGHDHGGQIRLPFLGSVAAMPHNLGQKYDRGLFMFEGVPLIIGQGVGESGPRARLWCPPQIVLVTLRY